MQQRDAAVFARHHDARAHARDSWARHGRACRRSGTYSRRLGHRLSRFEPHVALGFIALHQRHADDEHADADVREQHAVERARQTPEARDQRPRLFRDPLDQR